MQITKKHLGGFAVAEVRGRFARADIIELFEQRVRGACGGLKRVHLGGVAELRSSATLNAISDAAVESAIL